MSFKHNSSTDDDSDYNDRDPGREVVEKNIRNRLQRIADYTKDELNKVLKRVDKTLDNYEYSVQSSLIQHGMTHNDMSNVEYVADIKELESLLNDSLAKQRYKQRLMIFIVGQTEQASEKVKLLEQIEQFFNEQKQNFSSREFNNYDDNNEIQDEIDITLKSFDVKDCYIHVKTLGTKLSELNDEIIEYLIENAGTKLQAKGKKKLAQVAKQTKDQLTNLQSKLELANTEMMNRDDKIEILEKEIENLKNEIKTNEDKFQNESNRYETAIESYKNIINEYEDNIQEYKEQIVNLTIQKSEIENTADIKTTEENSSETIIPNQIEKEDKEIQTSYHSNENSEEIILDNIEDFNLLFNSAEEIDLNSLTAISNLRQLAIVRVRELLKELEIKESINNEIVQKFDEYKKLFEKEQNDLLEKRDSAYELQMKAQTTAEEAMSHLQFYMTEQENLKPDLIHQETQTDEQETFNTITSSPEQTNPIEESLNDQLSYPSKINTEEFESIENFRRTSLKEKYISIIEEKKYELDQLKQQAEIILSRPTSIRERIGLQLLENNDVSINQQPSIFSFENLVIKKDQEQQTSVVSSRRSSIHEEKTITEMISNDQLEIPFYQLYEIMCKFRHSTINLLEENKFPSFANCLRMIKQLSIDDNNQINDFIDNAEYVFKDIIKVFQTCIKTLQSTINEYQLKEKGIIKEPEIILENSFIDNQQSLIIEQKESIIIDLTTKYEQMTKILNQIHKKYEEDSKQNERLIADQQKLIQNFQQEIFRLQKRLVKIECEGIIEPSIMFTRFDAQRNDEALQQAVSKGKLPETTYNELNEVMTDYVELPSQQFINLVKRYIHFRKATVVEDRLQNEILDVDTKNVLQKIESLYERRSDTIRKHMSNIRQQRANLARILTEKFDQLDNESSIFLIRPVYSYQGRAAAQSYLKHVKFRRDALLNENATMRRHHPSRQSTKIQSANNQQDGNQQMSTPLSPISTINDEGRLFRIDKTLPTPRSSLVGQQNDSNDNKTDTKPVKVQMSEVTRLQELDFQRTLMPMSHASTPLISAFTNEGIDPCVPSLNLRSYVALSRPDISNGRMEEYNEIIKPISRGLFSLSAKSQRTNPQTPLNSIAGDLRRAGPSLPRIKRSLTSNVSPPISEIQHNTFVPAVRTNKVATTD